METAPIFNFVDIIALILVLLGLWQGYRRGLSGELAQVISAIVSVWVSWHYYDDLGHWLTDSTRLGPQESLAVAFILLILGAFLFTWVVRIILRHIMEFTFKERIEKMGGALAGLIRTSLIIAVVIFFAGLLPNEFLHRVFMENSLIGRQLDHYIPTAYEKLTEYYPNLPEFQQIAGTSNAVKHISREEFFNNKDSEN